MLKYDIEHLFGLQVVIFWCCCLEELWLEIMLVLFQNIQHYFAFALVVDTVEMMLMDIFIDSGWFGGVVVIN